MDLTVNSIDPFAWDKFVKEQGHGHYMQSHAWGTAQRRAGWSPHYLALVDGEAIRATALLLSRQIPLTGLRAFYAPRGPVVPADSLELLSEFTFHLRRYVRGQRGAFLRTDPYWRESDKVDGAFERAGFRKVPRDWSYWNAPKFVLWLDLEKDEESLFRGLESGCRNMVRAGYKNGVEFTLGSSEQIGDFHRLMLSTGLAKGIAVHDESYYRNLYDELSASCAVQIFVGRSDGIVVTTGMSVRYGGQAWLLYAASDREYSRLRANQSMQWEMIKWAHARGCVRYDFRGTATGDPPQQSDPGYGVYKFKKSFGPEFTRLAGYYDLPILPPAYLAFRFGEERVLPLLYKAKVWLDSRRSSRGPGVES